MSKIEYFKSKLLELEGRRMQFLRTGNYVKAMILDGDIKRIQKMLDDYEATQPKSIRELMSPEEIERLNIVPLVIECHLAADYLTDCAYNLNDAIERAGFHAVSMIPEIKEILKKSEAFASALINHSSTLSDLLVNNDTLIQALHKKTLSYIAQRAK